MSLKLPGATILAHDRVTGSVADPTWHALPKIDTPAVLLVCARAVAGGAALSVTLETTNAAGATVAVPGATFTLAGGVIAAVLTIPDDKLGKSARATITNGDAGVYDVLVALFHEAKYALALGTVGGLALLDTTPSAGEPEFPPYEDGFISLPAATPADDGEASGWIEHGSVGARVVLQAKYTVVTAGDMEITAIWEEANDGAGAGASVLHSEALISPFPSGAAHNAIPTKPFIRGSIAITGTTGSQAVLVTAFGNLAD